MTWSFVIVTYNSERHIGACLDSLSGIADSEIIIVDNASTDSTRNLLRERGVQLIEETTNGGFARACNKGAARAKGEYLCFINPDTVALKTVWPKLSDVFKARPDIGIISPRIVDHDGKAELFSRGRFPTLWRLITRSIRYQGPSSEEVSCVDWISGAVFAIRRSLFMSLGGFDEQFFMYFEDIDLCRRASATCHIAVVESAAVSHERGQSLADNRLRKNYYYRSQLLYFKKHFGKVSAFFLRLLRLPAVISSV